MAGGTPISGNPHIPLGSNRGRDSDFIEYIEYNGNFKRYTLRFLLILFYPIHDTIHSGIFFSRIKSHILGFHGRHCWDIFGSFLGCTYWTSFTMTSRRSKEEQLCIYIFVWYIYIYIHYYLEFDVFQVAELQINKRFQYPGSGRFRTG